ncbi:MAG: hypothetical protein ACI80V_003866 [Rhodothermales bacterium]|jgi:hypothetical protein
MGARFGWLLDAGSELFGCPSWPRWWRDIARDDMRRGDMWIALGVRA